MKTTIAIILTAAIAGCASPQAAQNYRPVGQPQMPQAQAHAQCQWQAMQAGRAASNNEITQAYVQVQTMDLCMAGMGYGR